MGGRNMKITIFTILNENNFIKSIRYFDECGNLQKTNLNDLELSLPSDAQEESLIKIIKNIEDIKKLETKKGVD